LARRILIIRNPAAGRRRRGERLLRQVRAALEDIGCEIVVRYTERPRDATRLAREAGRDFDVIVAAGGDGTVSEVVNGLAPGQPLALLPLGAANVLAEEIALPHLAMQLAELIAHGEKRPVWPGLVADWQFVAMAGAGFDADVVALVDSRLKSRLGKLAFLAALAKGLRRYRRREFVIRTESGRYRAASVIAAKGKFYAGRFRLAPEARITDPILQIVLFRRSGRVAVLRALLAMAFGALQRLPEVTILAARSAVIEGAGICHADGEIVTQLPATVRIADNPLLLVQPAMGGS
jgi:diacylglycerol kinase (ATP)